MILRGGPHGKEGLVCCGKIGQGRPCPQHQFLRLMRPTLAKKACRVHGDHLCRCCSTSRITCHFRKTTRCIELRRETLSNSAIRDCHEWHCRKCNVFSSKTIEAARSGRGVTLEGTTASAGHRTTGDRTNGREDRPCLRPTPRGNSAAPVDRGRQADRDARRAKRAARHLLSATCRQDPTA